MVSAYDSIVALLESVPWRNARQVTAIRPMGHRRLNFFPGQLGYCGSSFPIGEIMIVGNNFSNLIGYTEYAADLDYCDESRTWRNLNDLILPAADIPLERFWLTNYSLGVMDMPTSEYEFSAAVRSALEFQRVFEATVALMRPKLIVTLGEPAACYVGVDFVGVKRRREQVVRRRIRQHDTDVLSVVHPSARASHELFRLEGRRIRQAYESLTRGDCDASHPTYKVTPKGGARKSSRHSPNLRRP